MTKAEDVDPVDHEDGRQIKIRIPGTAHVTSVNQRGDYTVITVLPVDEGQGQAQDE
ncbi:hypothetical protein MRI28_19575 [Nocardiopsis dassonvillei]|uniref:hypothetical protein n=1 Tax=Nocardiopsis dassonvillei TaxID=2014 RepID=UPI00200EEEF6|nr:hypothetical protein [Nocardiopsis dassonvillei]MCK9871809.1 hypothetical protein [Nocardiopsis dassonvillei]